MGLAGGIQVLEPANAHPTNAGHLQLDELNGLDGRTLLTLRLRSSGGMAAPHLPACNGRRRAVWLSIYHQQCVFRSFSRIQMMMRTKLTELFDDFCTCRVRSRQGKVTTLPIIAKSNILDFRERNAFMRFVQLYRTADWSAWRRS